MLLDTLSWDMVNRLDNVTTSKLKGFNISKEKSRSFENDFFSITLKIVPSNIGLKISRGG